MSLMPAEVSNAVLAQINAQVFDQISTEPSLAQPPPPENVVKVVLANSLTTVQQQRPTVGPVDRDAFVRTYREAMAYFDQGAWELAEEAFRRVIGIWARPEIYVLLGYTHFYRGDFVRASNYFQKAATQDPQDMAAHLSLALAYNRAGKTRKAIGAVWNVVNSHRENADAHFLLGYLRHQLHQWGQAEQAYREALGLRKDFSVVYQYLALLYYEMGSRDEAGREEKFRKAIATYREAINADASASPSYINIGYIHDQLGEHEEATEAYRAAVQAVISNGEFVDLIALGMELLNAGRYEEAKATFKRSLELMGEVEICDGVSRVQVLTWIGTASLQLDNSRRFKAPDKELLREAEESFLAALALNPEYIHAQLGLGASYYAQGRVDDAIKAFQRALVIDPDNEPARSNLTALVEEKLERRLYEMGLLKQIREPITDFSPYQNRVPIPVRGKPVSETILEDRS
jgi:superkiller protein 3